jgi:predicted dienelactone hydrolase
MFKSLIVLLFGLIPLISTASREINYSSNGSLKVEVLEFRELRDLSRKAASKPARFRVFRRGKTNSETSLGREVPIKIHMPTSGGPYPVVIISHGAGGNWDTHYAQANHLASHGYAVFCLEHVGSNTERMKSTIRILHNLKEMIHDSNEVLGRPKDVSFAINQAAKWNSENEKLRGRLDLNHVGVMGHSFGAFTTMVVTGMRPALNWIEPKIAPGSGLGPNLLDERVKCGIALSPQAPGEPFFLKESYSSLRVPLMGISGTKDKQQNGEPPQARYESFKLWPEMQKSNLFIWLGNASHLDFTDSTGGDVHGRESSARADVQRVVRPATLIFFNNCLKNDNTPNVLITNESLKPYLRGEINSIEVLSK